MKKWLFVWEKSISRPDLGYQPVKPVLDGRPKRIIAAMGFDLDSREIFKVVFREEGNREEVVEYAVFQSLEHPLENMIRLESKTGQKTHLIKLEEIYHEDEARCWEILDRTHHNFPVHYDTAAESVVVPKRLAPKWIKTRDLSR